MVNVLFLCTGNSARSVLAEALMNHWGKGCFRAYSAGSQPTGRINPLAAQLLADMGMTDYQGRSKSWDEFADAPRMDLIFTVCDSAAAETCPIWPGHPSTAHWGTEDPAAAEGSQEERMAAFQRAFRILQHRVKACVELPVEQLGAEALQQRLIEIGKSLPEGEDKEVK
ncbi:MAG: arsenate reductase ArsC [Gammaproteobacteria bacterium]|jgi:arsenate reductase|nr:arsenate reductase ArsC [Gammaproteobacteria bacterium]